MSLERLNALAETAIAALSAGDYDEAINAALSAKLLMAVQPNLARTAAGNAQSMVWANAKDIDFFISHCGKLKTAALGATGGIFQQANINFGRSDATDDY